MLKPEHLKRRLDRAAPHFDDHAVVHDLTREALLSRLEPMSVTARTVIDLGAGTGRASRDLKRRFSRASVHSVDLSLAMLRQQTGSWLSRPSRIVASATALPLADASVDVVFANQLLPYVDNLPAAFAEVARVLVPGGVFAFATLGPDSFAEIRAAWAAVDDAEHVARFPDMHDLGDLIVRAGLSDPVLDVDHLNVSYREPARLVADLRALALGNALEGRDRGLAGRARLDAFYSALFGRPPSAATISLELVYGHAFGGTPREPRGPIRIDPSSIGTRARRG